jgi:hypothetical protein
MTGRQRPDVHEAMLKMETYSDERPRGMKRLFDFQFFVSALLIVLVVITGVSFAYALRSDRDVRERSLERQMLFETHVASILDEINDSQAEAHDERELIIERFDELLLRIEELD